MYRRTYVDMFLFFFGGSLSLPSSRLLPCSSFPSLTSPLSLCLPRDTLVTLVYTPSNWTIYASAFAFLCNNFGLVIIWYRGCKTRATWWDMQCTTDPVMFNRDSTVFYELQALRCTPLRTKKNKKKQSGQRGGWTRDQNRVEAVMTTCWALTAAHCPLMGGLGGWLNEDHLDWG